MNFKYEVWENGELIFRFYSKDKAIEFMSCRPNTKLVKIKPPTFQDMLDEFGEAKF